MVVRNFPIVRKVYYVYNYYVPCGQNEFQLLSLLVEELLHFRQ